MSRGELKIISENKEGKGEEFFFFGEVDKLFNFFFQLGAVQGPGGHSTHQFAAGGC